MDRIPIDIHEHIVDKKFSKGLSIEQTLFELQTSSSAEDNINCK